MEMVSGILLVKPHMAGWKMNHSSKRCVSGYKMAFFPASRANLTTEVFRNCETLEIRLVLVKKERPKFQHFGD